MEVGLRKRIFPAVCSCGTVRAVELDAGGCGSYLRISCCTVRLRETHLNSASPPADIQVDGGDGKVVMFAHAQKIKVQEENFGLVLR